VKWCLEADEIIERIARKYSRLTSVSEKAGKVIVVVSAVDPDDRAFTASLRASIDQNLALEIIGPDLLREKLRHHFQHEVVRFDRDELIRMRAAVERVKGGLAFGPEYSGSPSEAMLMWHFGCWTIRSLRDGSDQAVPADLLQTGLYRDVAILMADLSGFSAYVRDTRDDSVVQAVLTSFYTKTRRAVINCGGMLSQFVGDAVIAAFGVPVNSPGYIDQALECAVAIMDIGKSVSNKWQKHIDRVQAVRGCHTGLALGDMLVVPHRAYSRSHLGIVADSVNMAARLSSAARPGEIVVSNAFYNAAGKTARSHFSEMEPIEAKNVGRLQAWQWDVENTRNAAGKIQ
jgi:adenylate cyclase